MKSKLSVINPPFSVLEVFERNILDVGHQILMARVELQLFEHIDEDQTEDELNGQTSPFL